MSTSTAYAKTTLTASISGYTIQTAAQGANTNDGADITITSGAAGTNSPGGQPGDINLTAAAGLFGNEGGRVNITGGVAGPTSVGGSVIITAGAGAVGAAASASIGGTVTVTSGSAGTGVTDTESGQIIIETGLHTGTAIPALFRFNGSTYDPSGGTTQSTRIERFVTNMCNPNLVLATPLDVLTWTLTPDSFFTAYASGSVYYSIMLKQDNVDGVAGGHSQIANGQVNFTSVVSDGLVVTYTVAKINEINSTTDGGSLTSAWDINYAVDTAAECNLQTTVSSTISSPAYLVIFMTLISNCQTHIAYIVP